MAPEVQPRLRCEEYAYHRGEAAVAALYVAPYKRRYGISRRMFVSIHFERCQLFIQSVNVSSFKRGRHEADHRLGRESKG